MTQKCDRSAILENINCNRALTEIQRGTQSICCVATYISVNFASESLFELLHEAEWQVRATFPVQKVKGTLQGTMSNIYVLEPLRSNEAHLLEELADSALEC